MPLHHGLISSAYEAEHILASALPINRIHFVTSIMIDRRWLASFVLPIAGTLPLAPAAASKQQLDGQCIYK